MIKASRLRYPPQHSEEMITSTTPEIHSWSSNLEASTSRPFSRMVACHLRLRETTARRKQLREIAPHGPSTTRHIAHLTRFIRYPNWPLRPTSQSPSASHNRRKISNVNYHMGLGSLSLRRPTTTSLLPTSRSSALTTGLCTTTAALDPSRSATTSWLHPSLGSHRKWLRTALPRTGVASHCPTMDRMT